MRIIPAHRFSFSSTRIRILLPLFEHFYWPWHGGNFCYRRHKLEETVSVNRLATLFNFPHCGKHSLEDWELWKAKFLACENVLKQNH